MKKKLPHLNVKDFESIVYTRPKGGGGGGDNRPERNRNEHSELLKSQLSEAWKESVNEQIVYKTRRNGVYLEFKGEQGYELATKSLENRVGKNSDKWIRLLNVRFEISEAKQPDLKTKFATVFVPNDKKDWFFKKIEKYATENTKTGSPANAPLLENISQIRKALEIESFWQDSKDLIPEDSPEWCEVWLSSDQDDILKRFDDLLKQKNIEADIGIIRFPERAVKIIKVNRSQLATITRLSDDIAEYRRAKETAAFWLDMENKEQTEWVDDILDRLDVQDMSDVAVCILDTGVNHGHPMLNPVLDPNDCQSVLSVWGVDDHKGHGTLMAGVSAYGDLQEILEKSDPVHLNHRLESVKILPPNGKNDAKLWGDIVAQGISLAEIQSPNKKRIICMAITADDTRDRGVPSSWSGRIDQICAGTDDDERRFFIVSAGNASLKDRGNYPESHLTDSVHDPGQAWNLLTVGAFTQLDQIKDKSLSQYKPVAAYNSLSPYTTTSVIWDEKWPIKPEIVMEGGNLAKDSSGFSTECDDLSLISTYHDPQVAHFSRFEETSASTANAAWFAAQIQTKYPDYWPETIRGLMVHSAEWTEELKQQFMKGEGKAAYRPLLRVCGYGVPSLEKALYCASNSLTLIAQSELQPFEEKDGKSEYKTKDMHLYELPWPKEALLNFSDDATVQMRVTLSYFIEPGPGPGRVGWNDRYRYPSHGLRFDINSYNEFQDQFVQRINGAVRGDGGKHPGTKSAADKWVIGEYRNKGSIHSDIWIGSPAELATSNMIAVYPTTGWWKERKHLKQGSKKTRYTLIVSIDTPEEHVDIYTPVETKISVSVPVEI